MIGIAQQLAAQLLRHPTTALERQLGHISEIAALLPTDVGTPLARLAAHLRGTGPDAAVEEYTTIFEPGGALLLLSHPDDLAFTLAYQQAGFRLAETERADFLPAVLEFAAARVAADDFRGQELLCGYRPAIDAIADRLAERDSPYLLAMDAIGATLPLLHPAA
ncbi:nitrate reductase molybdenum cofactor assembly chaperone [Rugosimonospora acidiphila]|uniref:nitrate reductase molybdenum cofactor assembly chaperone n=1 Tax=Rugosimonospora acidiphila TaxID=556531 RepID=UPI0031ECD4D3